MIWSLKIVAEQSTLRPLPGDGIAVREEVAKAVSTLLILNIDRSFLRPRLAISANGDATARTEHGICVRLVDIIQIVEVQEESRVCVTIEFSIEGEPFFGGDEIGREKHFENNGFELIFIGVN
jgi:hypothetical protein